MAQVHLRPLFAILIAAAMLFAPFAMPAKAMAPADDHSRAMSGEHCADAGPAGDEGKAEAQSSCFAMCAAIATAPASSLAAPRLAPFVQQAAPVRFIRGHLAELATPPPRLS